MLMLRVAAMQGTTLRTIMTSTSMGHPRDAGPHLRPQQATSQMTSTGLRQPGMPAACSGDCFSEGMM